MQGQRGTNNLFAETTDLNQGTVSSNNGSNPPTGWNSMLYPMENHNVRNFNSWHIGESSSSSNPNLQSQGLAGNVKNENPFDNIESLSRPLNVSSRTPLNINLNADDMDIDDPFTYNIGNNDCSSSSFNDWGSSVKRKDLDSASSNYFQQGETFGRHDFRSDSSNLDAYTPSIHSHSFSHAEELNLRIGIGQGTSSDAFPPVSVTETGESSSRNYGVRINHDNNLFNLPSMRNNTRSSDFNNSRQSSRPISPPDTFEFRPFSSTVRTHTPDLQRTMPPFASHVGRERGFLSREGGNGMEHSPFAHFAEIRNNPNSSPENQNSSPENVRNSVSHFGSPWAPPPPHGLSRNIQRSSQLYPWAPFSSEETMMTSGVNQGPHRNLPSSRSEARELPGDDVGGWHALAADIEGRQRLVSDIRHVLNAMRRGDNLRDEDYMFFDPFINGVAELHDRHRDMRLDVDNMSYEELLALEERIGDVNTGLSEEAILRSLKPRKPSTVEPCSICREEYVLGDNVGELDCGHDFHTDCIKQWLIQKNICPICKMTALGTSK